MNWSFPLLTMVAGLNPVLLIQEAMVSPGCASGFRDLAVSAKLPAKTPTETPISQTVSDQFIPRFTLSWSHYIVLMTIDNRDERRFYEIESRQNQWSLSELKRQFNSAIYERLALSRDKKGVKALADKGQIIGNPQDVLKDPYVLEFLELDENTHYSESDLESAIIDKLEIFLLELR